MCGIVANLTPTRSPAERPRPSVGRLPIARRGVLLGDSDYGVWVYGDRETRLVTPFYLKMMRLNAIESGPEIAPSILAASSGVTADDVVALLRDPWRATVMGAWFGVLRDEEDVVDAVLSALARSQGSLDAPPLAVAAVVIAGERAVPALATYLQRDVTARLGAAGFIAAAIEHLGGSTQVEQSKSDIDDLHAMMRVAMMLRRGGVAPS